MRSAIRLVPEIDGTVASQSSYTSGGSLQDACGELTGVVQEHPVQSCPFISNFLWKDFRCPYHPRNESRGEKVKTNKHFSAADTRWQAAKKKKKSMVNQHQVGEVICNALLVKLWIFLIYVGAS